MAGILLSVASATAAVVIADTQQAQVDLRFDLQRSSRVVIQAANNPPEGFLPGQLAAIQNLASVYSVGELSIVAPNVTISRSPDISGKAQDGPLVIADPGGLASAGARVVVGAPADLLGARDAPAMVWLGEGLAKRLGVQPAIGRGSVDAQVVVRGVAVSVAGVIRAGPGFRYLNQAVISSRSTGVALWGGTAEGRLVAHVRPGAAKAVADYMIKAADPSGKAGLRNATPPDGERLLKNVGGDLKRVGAALGLFIGVIGMIAVANTLMMSVQQRYRELGLRSAMGWSRRRIGALVLTEAGIAGLVAGLVGSALGLLVGASWCWFQDWSLVVPRLLPPLVIAGGLVASIIGGLVPAIRASSISPLTAMRS